MSKSNSAFSNIVSGVVVVGLFYGLIEWVPFLLEKPRNDKLLYDSARLEVCSTTNHPSAGFHTTLNTDDIHRFGQNRRANLDEFPHNGRVTVTVLKNPDRFEISAPERSGFGYMISKKTFEFSGCR